MRLFHLMVILGCLSTLTLYAEPRVEWIRSYGGEGHEEFKDIYAVSNGDFIMCGKSNRTSWVVRIDSDGNELWSNVYAENPGSSTAYSVIETDQGNFLTGGCDAGQVNAILVNGDGDLIWNRNYAIGSVKAVIELKSSEFLLCGQAAEGDEWWGYVLMINGDGDVLWENTYDPGVYGRFEGMRETEGGIVLAGGVQPERLGDSHGWLVKINPEGDVIWERTHQEGSWTDFRTITSVPRGGFAMTGEYHDRQRIGVYPGFYVLKVNEIGEREWFETWENNNSGNMCLSLISVNDQGFAAVGNNNTRGVGWRPKIYRLNTQDAIRWVAMYEWEGMAEPFRSSFNSVILNRENSLFGAGYVQSGDSTSYNGLVMKLEPEILGPMIFYWIPQDTLLTVLPRDTVQFIVRARNQLGLEMEYLWIMGEDTLSDDTTTTIMFGDIGEYLVQCQVSDEDFTSSIGWHVTATDFFIRDFHPDSLDLVVRRNSSVDFIYEIAALEGLEFEYFWEHSGRGGNFEIEGEDSIRYQFDLSGEHRIHASVAHGEEVEEIEWNINVRSAIWSWWPWELDLSAYVDSTLEFVITPFDEDSDSLEYVWLLDGDPLVSDSASVLVAFSETGQSELTSIVHDGVEADTISWVVNVDEWSFTADYADFADLPTSPVLYPASPNPFNSSVKLSMYLPRAEHVSLSIFDVNGREVSRLVDGDVGAGSRTFVWDAGDFPAGVYVVRMEAGDMSEMRKVVLVR